MEDRKKHRRPPLCENTMRRIAAGFKKFGGAEPFLISLRGTSESHLNQAHSIEEPLLAVTSGGYHHLLAEPFLIKYYGTGGAVSIDDPLDTVTAKPRFMLVMPDGSRNLYGCRTRMLAPHELAAAMGFHEGYQFDGNQEDVIKQIGNAVEVNLAEAHCGIQLAA